MFARSLRQAQAERNYVSVRIPFSLSLSKAMREAAL